MARVRFLTERIKTVESALGIGYIDDAGLDYKDFITGEYPLTETATATTHSGEHLPVVGTSGVTEALAQTSDRAMQKHKRQRTLQVSNQ